MPHSTVDSVTMEEFLTLHAAQLKACGIHERFWPTLFEKLTNQARYIDFNMSMHIALNFPLLSLNKNFTFSFLFSTHFLVNQSKWISFRYIRNSRVKFFESATTEALVIMIWSELWQGSLTHVDSTSVRYNKSYVIRWCDISIHVMPCPHLITESSM